MKRIPVFLSVFCLSFYALSFAVDVFSGHPRLFFRDSAWGERSITTVELKKRARDTRYQAYVNRLNYSAANFAMKALLLDDSTAAAECVKMLTTAFEFDQTTDDGVLVMWAAMAFDWLYNSPYFSAAAKSTAINNLVQGARWCKDQYTSQGAHIFHTRMYAFATGVGLAGLVLKGHHPEADTFINWAYSIYLNDLFPARHLQGGSVHNSLAYGRKYTIWLDGHFMSGWYSATGEDLWKKVRQEQEDWAWREAEFIMYARQPDGLLVRYGDCFRRTSERFSFQAIGERAFAYNEPIGAYYLNYLFETQAKTTDPRVVEEGNAYNVFLFWDADKQGKSFTTLPTRTMFGQHGTGMVFWRTDWDNKETFIFFKCGNYFDDHGHFDQGHLEVFRGAPLLIEAGAYEGDFNSTFRLNFYRKAIAHNTILAVNPAFSEDEGGQRVYSNQSLGTMTDYLADTGSETGDITVYQDNGKWTYLAGDFSKAYDLDRIVKAIREVAWLGERYLVVVDNITLGSNKLLPRVLWHYTVKPVLGEKRFTVSDGGGRAAVTLLAPSNAVIDTVQEYRIGTAYYLPPDPRPSIGVGRAEISVPSPGATDYTFIEVIDVADEGVPVGNVSLASPDSSSLGVLKIDLPVGTLILRGNPGARSEVSFTASTWRGDYNDDRMVDIQDVISLILRARDNPGDPAFDFDGDGGFTIMDAVALVIYIRSQSPGLLARVSDLNSFK